MIDKQKAFSRTIISLFSSLILLACTDDVCRDICTTMESCMEGNFPHDSSSECVNYCHDNYTEDEVDCSLECDESFLSCEEYLECVSDTCSINIKRGSSGNSGSDSDKDDNPGTSSDDSEYEDTSVCKAGKKQDCSCGGDSKGIQECKQDGSGWKECRCDCIGTGGYRCVYDCGGPNEVIKKYYTCYNNPSLTCCQYISPQKTICEQCTCNDDCNGEWGSTICAGYADSVFSGRWCTDTCTSDTDCRIGPFANMGSNFSCIDNVCLPDIMRECLTDTDIYWTNGCDSRTVLKESCSSDRVCQERYGYGECISKDIICRDRYPASSSSYGYCSAGSYSSYGDECCYTCHYTDGMGSEEYCYDF